MSSEQAPYNESTGVIQSWVATLDLLAFSAGIVQAAASQTSDAHLKALRTTLRKANAELSTDYWTTKFYSDNALVACPIHSDGESESIDVWERLAAYQHRLVFADYTVRGALGVGEAYVDEDLAYGLAMLEAHYSEQCVAKYPRIILTKPARRAAARYCEYFDKTINRAASYPLLVDHDGEWFIDYLWIDDHYFEEDLSQHQAIVQRNLNCTAGHRGRHAKHEWVAAYHNYVCEVTGNQSLKVSDSLTIPGPRGRISNADVEQVVEEQHQRARDDDEYSDIAKVIEIATRRIGDPNDGLDEGTAKARQVV